MENKKIEDAKKALLDIVDFYKYKEDKIKEVEDFFKKINFFNYYDLFSDELFFVNNDMVNSAIKEEPIRLYDDVSVVNLNKLVNEDVFLRNLTNVVFRKISFLFSVFQNDVYRLSSRKEVDDRTNKFIEEIMTVLDSMKDSVALNTLPSYSKLRKSDFLKKINFKNNFKIIIGKAANNKKERPCECDDFRFLLYYVYSLNSFFRSQKKEVVELDLYKEILRNICSELSPLFDSNKDLKGKLNMLYLGIKNIKTSEQLEKTYIELKDMYLSIRPIIDKDDNDRLFELFLELGFNNEETNKRSLK